MPTKTRKTKPIVEEVEVEETSMPDADETITFKRSHFYSALVVLAFGVGLMLGYVLWGGDKVVTVAAPAPEADQPSVQQNQPPVQQQAAAPSEPEAPVRYDIPTDGYPSLGPADAPITIVEFSDYQCPYCRRFHQQTFQALFDAYPGQIRFVYRNLPVTGGSEPVNSAMAALCANEQGVFWEYHDKLFSSDQLGWEIYRQYAEELELDLDEFAECYESGRQEEVIAADVSFSSNIGVRSTPTFFINGLAFVGAQPLVNFQQVIDQELANQ